MRNRSPRRLRIAVSGILLLLSICSFVFAENVLVGFTQLQFGPALLRFVSGFGIAGILIVTVTLVVSFVFGRVFCSVICPLGAVQDGIRAVAARKSGTVPNYRFLRYFILLLVIVLLIAGLNIGFRIFDPFSRFGAMVYAGIAVATSFTEAHGGWPFSATGGLVSILLLVGLVVWKKRIFCVSLCPVGTLLGLVARHGVFRTHLNGKCVGCKQCERHCPTGCINVAERAVDNERCVLCLDCISVCSVGGIRYSTSRVGNTNTQITSPDAARRAFLFHGVVAAVSLASFGFGARRLSASESPSPNGKRSVLPPGAGNSQRFGNSCTSCQLCAAACPTGAIEPTMLGLGAMSLNFSKGRCDHNCVRCSDVCPTGALQKMTLEEKQWLRIGEATFEHSRCHIVANGTSCALCSQVCPMGAIFQSDPRQVPEVNAYHCIGCGACENICPASPKAMTVRPIENQEAI